MNQKIQAKRKVRNCYATFFGGWDGVGAQIHAIISIQIFARKYGLTYVHTPLKDVEHYKGDRSLWSDKWEKFFSLGANELTPSDVSHLYSREKYLKFPFLIFKKENTLYRFSNCHTYTELVIEEYEKIVSELKTKFWSNGINKKEERQTEVIKISVHIRRGDVTATNNLVNRYTDDLLIERRIQKIVDCVNGMDIKFTLQVVSQGSEGDFSFLQKFNPVYLLNYDEFESFRELVKSDVLITAKSSFSYVAALLTDGLVYYENFWHTPLSKWVIDTTATSNLNKALIEMLQYNHPQLLRASC